MFRAHWREPRFWRWWWHNRTSPGVRLVAPWALLLLLVGGGWAAADRLSSAKAGGDQAVVLATTVERVVTVREHGKVVTKIVPVTRVVRLRAATEYRPTTLYATQVVTKAGGVRVVTHPVVRYVPKVRTAVVTRNGPTVTALHTVTNTKVRTVVDHRTVTNTATVDHPVTSTVTETRPVTVRRTVTNTVTETQPVTVTQTVRRTVTNTVTETRPVTVTQTAPTVTVVVTVTTPAAPPPPPKRK